MLDEPLFYALAIPAMLIVGISKAGFGGGLGIVAVPIISLIMPAFQAAAVILPSLCLMDVILVWVYRHHWDGPSLKAMLPGSVIGIAAGTLLIGILSPLHIKLVIGVIALLFTARYFLRDRRYPEGRPANSVMGAFWGGVSGLTSFFANAGGPPFSIYMLPRRFDKTVFVGTATMFFAGVNFMKLVPYTWLGQFQSDALWASLALMPVAPLSLWLGVKLHARVDQKLFYLLCYLFLIPVGFKLVADGLGLW